MFTFSFRSKRRTPDCIGPEGTVTLLRNQYRIYRKYSDTLTPNHTCKIGTISFSYLIMCFRNGAWKAKCRDSDQTPRSAASDLGLHFIFGLWIFRISVIRKKKINQITILYVFWQVWANSVDPDLIMQNAASDQGLHCLPFTLIWISRIVR